jgi:hypothetical protein
MRRRHALGAKGQGRGLSLRAMSFRAWFAAGRVLFQLPSQPGRAVNAQAAVVAATIILV